MPQSNMNKQTWRAQKSLNDLRQWHTWAASSTEAFIAEYRALGNSPKLPTEDAQLLRAVRDALQETQKTLKRLAEAENQATVQRVRSAQAAADPSALKLKKKKNKIA